MNRPVHFEIISKDPEKSAEFYKNAFGWSSNSIPQMRYWMVMTDKDKSTVPGINGGIMSDADAKNVFKEQVPAYICTIDVENIDEAIEKVKLAGGTLVNEKMDIPTVGWHVYCKDIDGNIFGMLQATGDMSMQ